MLLPPVGEYRFCVFLFQGLHIGIHCFRSEFAGTHCKNDRCGTRHRIPPAYTPGLDVAMVVSSAMMPPHFAHSRLSRRCADKGIRGCPMDIMTVSTSKINSEPSLTIGLHLPDSSGSPSVISTHFIPVT